MGNGWIGLWGFWGEREMTAGRVGGKGGGGGGGGKGHEDVGIPLMDCMHGYGALRFHDYENVCIYENPLHANDG